MPRTDRGACSGSRRLARWGSISRRCGDVHGSGGRGVGVGVGVGIGVGVGGTSEARLDKIGGGSSLWFGFGASVRASVSIPTGGGRLVGARR